MANLFQKFSRNKSTLGIFTNHKAPLAFPKLTPPLINTNNTVLFSDPPTTDNAISTQKLQFFPNYPFGYCLNPISSTGFDRLKVIGAEKEVEADANDARTIWADSVKKKRKKKMNKHKYKKLRKRLRRKT